MNQNEINALSDAELAKLSENVAAAAEARREKITLESIRPGMSQAEQEKVRKEIARLLSAR